MVNHIRKTLLVFVFYVISQVYCCEWNETSPEVQCDDLESVSVQGEDTWSNLIVHNRWTVPFVIGPDSFKSVPNLKELHVKNIDTIEPDAFKGLSQLDVLTISKSFLEIVPSGVFDNLQISRLGLVNSAVTYIPHGFFEHLPVIRFVDFKENKMTQVQTGIYNDTLIFELYLDNNLIESIEDNAFIKMNYLVHLGLSGNRLTTFESLRVLGSSQSLEILKLNNNQLTKLTTKLVESVPNLKILSVDENQISSIEDGSFRQVQNIHYIDMANNHLTEVQPKIFPVSGLQKLTHLILHRNRLTFISKALFLRAPNLTDIIFGGNPYQCACLDSIKRWTENMTRVCYKVFFESKYPTCVDFEPSNSECVYDDQLTSDLYDKFTTALASYSNYRTVCTKKI